MLLNPRQQRQSQPSLQQIHNRGLSNGLQLAPDFALNNEDNANMSRSLGDYKQVLHRTNSDPIISISHSGYLFKRSNQPFRSPTELQKHVDANNNIFTTAPISCLSVPLVEDITITPYGALSMNGSVGLDMKRSLETQPLLPTSKYVKEDLLHSPEKENAVDLTISLAADFFGFDDELIYEIDKTEPKKQSSVSTVMENSEYISTEAEMQYLRNENNNNTEKKSASSKIFSRCTSDTVTSNNSQNYDFVDPRDGHIWRSKYCVLENGILYFYRNPVDANSPEAKNERNENPLPNDKSEGKSPSMDFLSKSPMTRHIPTPTPPRAESFCNDQNVIWEKRVALDCVGVVRSAEDEYGNCSFALLTSDDDDIEEGTDCLILRAGSQTEMQEWLFQFHCALAFFMRQIVDSVRTNSPCQGSGFNKLLQPPVMIYPLIAPRGAASPYHIGSYPNSGLNIGKPFAKSLSHGHGRYCTHRKKHREKTNSHSLASTPGNVSPAYSTSSWDIGGGIPSPYSEQIYADFKPQVVHVVKVNGGFSNISSQLPLKTDEKQSDSLLNKNHTIDIAISQPITNALNNSQSLQPEEESCIQKKPVPKAKKYIPPHLRKKVESASITSSYLPPHRRENNDETKNGNAFEDPVEVKEDDIFEMTEDEVAPHKKLGNISPSMNSILNVTQNEEVKEERNTPQHLKLGGCADPTVAIGSILDPIYARGSASVSRVRTEAFGRRIEASSNGRSSVFLDVGAVSECGVRESNEDAYLITSDLSCSLGKFENGTEWLSGISLFAIFDGHCGTHAARFATEKLVSYLRESALDLPVLDDDSALYENRIKQCLRSAIKHLDKEFCLLCKRDGRDWYSGATALITLIHNDTVIVANLGDCLCVASASSNSPEDHILSEVNGWTPLDANDPSGIYRKGVHSYWKEVTNAHSPSREDERKRILDANGWITTETEVCTGQLHRMDFDDADALEILERCLSRRSETMDKKETIQDGASKKDAKKNGKALPGRILKISRVCGELAVSRALGDRDFKADYSEPSTDIADNMSWRGPNFLLYTEGHSECFKGDLVTAEPEVEVLKVGRDGCFDEFLIMACDGLWDVMDVDDAARIAQDLMFNRGWSAKKSAARLAELAIHLGSSDNTTVILVRFISGHKT